MKSVITGETDGKSRILSVEEIGEDPLARIWQTTAQEPMGAEKPPGGADSGVPKVEKGSSLWQIVALPPFEHMREFLKQGVPGLDENGFHRTGTIDYVVVLDGPVTLALDEEEVELSPGDIVVQRNTNHAWYNRGDRPIRLLALMTGVEGGG